MSRITRLEQQMASHGVNAPELARLSGVSESTVRRCVELGAERTTVINAWRMAHAMGLRVDDLLGEAR